MKKIDSPLKYIETSLFEGASNRKSPFHLAVISYFYEKQSYACNVVLREFDKEKNFLRFNSDFRSKKIKSLLVNPDIQLHFYDSSVPCQLRVSATANVIHNNEDSLLLWNNISDMSKQCYFQKFSPGQRVVEDTDYKLSNSMDAYYNFCSVILSIKSYDFLVLDSSVIYSTNSFLLLNFFLSLL